MNGLSLDSILSELHKTASVEEPTQAPAPVAAAPVTEVTKVAAAKAELMAALKNAESKVAEKTASAPVAASPAGELEKVAQDLAAADQEAIVKEAQLYGTAIADGFMARLSMYEGAAEALPASEKTASAGDVEKIASEAVRGYVETQQAIKTASTQEFQRGYNDAAVEIEKIASDSFGQGAQDCINVLQVLANS